MADMIASAAGRDVLALLRASSDALRDFTDALNRGIRSGGEMSDSFGMATNAAKKIADRSISDFAFGIGQDAINSRAFGTDYSFGGSAAYQASRVLENVPLAGDVFARDFDPVKNAESRVSAINSMIARAGGKVDTESTQALLGLYAAQEDRAAQAALEVHAAAVTGGFYNRAFSNGLQRLGAVVGVSDLPAPLSVYDVSSKIGAGVR